MAVPSTPGKLLLQTPATGAAASIPVDISPSVQESSLRGPNAAVAAAAIPGQGSATRPEAGLRALVRALARQAAREQAAALISQDALATNTAAGDA
jgi:hypothetical protein